MFLLLGTLWVNADERTFRQRGPNQPLYVVTHNHYAQGFTPAGPTARFGDLIMIEIFNPKAVSSDQTSSYEVGRRYALFVGGERRGDVKIERVTPLQCNSSAAVVSADPSVHLSTEAMALATNAKMIRPHQNAQHQANAIERSQAMRLAMEGFRKHGVPDEAAKDIQIEHLVVTKVDHRGQRVLIGSLSVKAKGARHDMFLIGGITGSKSSIELARYHKTTDLEDGKDSERVRFVDQLDLDHDGTDEVVIEVTGYENEQFEIYTRQDGAWRQAWVGGQGGC